MPPKHLSVMAVLKTVATEFSNTPDEVIETWIDLTTPFLSETIFGKFYVQALAYLTAHRMKMAGLGDNTYGTISDTLRVGSFNEGDTAITYNTSQSTNILTNAELSLTTYGLSFLSCRRMVSIPIRSAGGIQNVK